jgi:molybdopterin converting factor subunit 1
MSSLNILFFASLKDKVGARQIILDVPESTHVADLRSVLAGHFPDASQSLSTCLVAINRTFAFDQDLIPFGAEVAFFPPVSGG